MCCSNCPYENWEGECTGRPKSLNRWRGVPHCFEEDEIDGEEYRSGLEEAEIDRHIERQEAEQFNL